MEPIEWRTTQPSFSANLRPKTITRRGSTAANDFTECRNHAYICNNTSYRKTVVFIIKIVPLLPIHPSSNSFFGNNPTYRCEQNNIILCTHNSIPTQSKAWKIPTMQATIREMPLIMRKKSLRSPAESGGKMIMDNHKKNSTGGYI